MSKFSTLNESSLHSSLKTFYAVQNNGKTEINEDGHIYDIVADTGEIIEIQTKNLSQLKTKIEDILQHDKKIKLVHPLVINDSITLTDQDGHFLYKRKSPKKGNIYDIFKELTGLTNLLLNDNFSLDIVEINMSEHRVKLPEPVQSKNKKRRIKRDWIKVDKHLEEILTIHNFSKKEDYLKLLPSTLPLEFIVNDFKNELENQGFPKRTINESNRIIWVLKNMNLISQIGKKGKAYLYKIN